MGIVRKAPGKSIVWHRGWPGNIPSTAEQEGQTRRIPGIRFGVLSATGENGTRARRPHWKRSFHRFEKC